MMLRALVIILLLYMWRLCVVLIVLRSSVGLWHHQPNLQSAGTPLLAVVMILFWSKLTALDWSNVSSLFGVTLLSYVLNITGSPGLKMLYFKWQYALSMKGKSLSTLFTTTLLINNFLLCVDLWVLWPTREWEAAAE